MNSYYSHFQTATGGSRFGSRFSTTEEYNPSLQGREGIAIYNQMRRSDGQCAAVLRDLKAPIEAAAWSITSEDDDVADALSAMLGISRIGTRIAGRAPLDWSSFLGEMLTSLEFGFSIHEKSWRIDNEKLVLDRLSFRPQSSVESWEVSKWGDFLGVMQVDPKTKGRVGEDKKVFLASEDLVLMNIDAEGSNFSGMSVLRPAYKHWFIKEALYRIDAIAIEKFGVGIPIARPMKIDDHGGFEISKESSDEAEKIVREMRAGNSAHIVSDGSYDFAFLDLGNNSRYEPYTAIEHHDNMISKSVAAQFLQYGMGTSGNQSLVEQIISLFFRVLQKICERIVDVVNRSIIEPWLSWNFGENIPQATLHFSRLENENFSASSEALAALVGAKVIEPDGDLEAFVRNSGGYPPKSSDMGDDGRAMP